MTDPKNVADIRAEMAKQKLDGFFVARADEFNGEYVPDAGRRLEFATGFDGSNGFAVILKDDAAFFTDSRYTLAAEKQVDQQIFSLHDSQPKDRDKDPKPVPHWIENNLPKGARFGIDPYLHTVKFAQTIEDTIKKAGGTLVLVDDNPLDAAWTNRPAAPQTPVEKHLVEYAGKDAADKRADVADALKKAGTAALVMTLPEEVCWLLNVRGKDVPYTPFALSYAITHEDGSVDWFIDQTKVSDDIRQWVGPEVRIHDFEDFETQLTKTATNKNVWIDPDSAPVKVKDTIKKAGGTTHEKTSPVQMMKTVKNDVEIEGMINGHIIDGIALTRFLARLDDKDFVAQHDELSAAKVLEQYRRENPLCQDLSFETISGAGPNGADVHYRVTDKSKLPLTAGPVYLCDSGGQYRGTKDGKNHTATTDVTRAVAVDTSTAHMKKYFTLVLQGHIKVAMHEFRAGESSKAADKKARESLIQACKDDGEGDMGNGHGYGHRTGHSVDSYGSVHGGLCDIGAVSTLPLEPGMILSNEPGYYRDGEYGIRIENLMRVVDTGKKDTDGTAIYGFKTMTMAPIDRNLIEPSLMEDNELQWLNAYHDEVRNTLLPHLQQIDPEAADFLKRATQVIVKPAAPTVKNGNTPAP